MSTIQQVRDDYRKEFMLEVDDVLDRVREELGRAILKHGMIHSPHEGWAVIREELEPELWEHVTGDTGKSKEAEDEAIQIAAMAVRYIVDLCRLT